MDPDSNRLRRGAEEVKLEPKVMQVLVCLAQQPGKVVSRESLETMVWAGMVVGYDAISGSIIKLRRALGDDSRNPLYIETVSKKGYRLIAAVTPDVEAADFLAAKAAPASEAVFPGKLLLAAIVLVGIVALWNFSGSESGPYEKAAEQAIGKTAAKAPSIVVLPFKNLSDDSRQDYFSDGITDDIITDLSKVGSLRVVARQSAYHYQNKTTDLEEIARQLDVRYVVEGSVQKAGQRVRINVQLTNAEKGEHIWAERFDSDAANVFDVQDKITKHVIDAMFVTLSNKENTLLEYRNTNNFEAYDTFLLGQQHSRNRTRQGFELAQDAYKQAIKLDPGYARVYGSMAVLYTNAYRHQWTNLSIEEARERAMELVKKAVLLDQSSPQVYWSLGFVHLFRKEFEEAEAAAMQAIELSPNYADGLGLLAFILNWRGKAAQAAGYIKKAIVLNPHHTFDYPWNLGLAYYTLGRYEESIEAIQDALERNETAALPRLFLGANYIRVGRQDDAEWEIEQVKTQRPGTTLSHLANTLPYENPQLMQAFLQDVRKAGLPE